MSEYTIEGDETMRWDVPAAIAASDKPATERAGYRRLVAKYAGTCDSCGGTIAKGAEILYNRRHELRLLCLGCGGRADAGEKLERNGPPRKTTRERREARLELRQEWAGSRETKAAVALEIAHAAVEGIPFGQPILAGHHSQRRHVAAIKRSNNADRRYIEHADMAKRHEHAAAEIGRQLRTSIYSDDPDAIERLEEKIARLEQQRETIKTRNAAFKKERAAELRALDSNYARDRAMPHQGYELTNLSGNINRQKKRLEQLRREEG